MLDVLLEHLAVPRVPLHALMTHALVRDAGHTALLITPAALNPVVCLQLAFTSAPTPALPYTLLPCTAVWVYLLPVPHVLRVALVAVPFVGDAQLAALLSTPLTPPSVALGRSALTSAPTLARRSRRHC